MISVNGSFINPLEELDAAFKKHKNYIHIRIRQRTGRTHVTTVEGLSQDLDLKKMCSSLQKEFNCGGHVTRDDDDNQILVLNGDQRKRIYDFLIREGISDKDSIKSHGY